MTLRKIADDEVGEAGISDGFSDAKKKAAEKERGETARVSGEKCGRGPDGESETENFCGGETVGEPPGKNQEGSVGEEEGREKNAEASRRNGKFVLKSGCGDGEGAAVNVRDEEREEEKGEDCPESGRKLFRCR